MSQSMAPEMPLPVTRTGASPRELVLCAIDDDRHAMEVVATGAHLAAAGRVDLLFVHVATSHACLPVNAGRFGVDEILAEARAHGRDVLCRLGLGGAHTHVMVALSPGRALRAAAVTFGASAIVVVAGRGGILRRAFGCSVTHDLIRDSVLPVVVARPERVLQRAAGPVVAVGGGAATVRWGVRLARLLDRPLVSAGDEQDAAEAALLVVPYPRGVVARALGRGRVALQLAMSCRAPVAVLPLRR